MGEARKPEVVVVTGASAGVGRAIVREFAGQKASIGLLARGIEGLEAARREVEEAGGRALVLPADVSNADEVESAAEKVEKEFGPIDIWINNAMVSVFSPFKDMTAEDFRRVNEVTYMGYVYGTMSAIKRMVPRNHGTIVQVSSALAYRAIPLQSAYCGAKHAIKGFTESLRTELLHDGSFVRVTMVHLPAVNTPQFNWVKSRLANKAQPVPPIYQPEIPAKAVLWAAHNAPKEINVGISTHVAIWSSKLFPGLGDWYLASTGTRAQQTDEPENPRRPDNLWKPLPGDAGAHGRFSRQAHTSSPSLWVRMHLKVLLLASSVAAGICALRRNR